MKKVFSLIFTTIRNQFFFGWIAVFCCLSGSLVAKNHLIDSLSKRLLNVENDILKIDIYQKLGTQFIDSLPNKALEFYNIGLSLSTELGLEKQIANTQILLGEYYSRIENNNKKSKDFLSKSLDIFKSIGDLNGIGRALSELGVLHWRMGDFKKSVILFFKAIKSYEKTDNNIGISSCYNRIGLVYWHQKYYDKALEFYSKALEIDIDLDNKIGQSNIYNNLGLIYRELGEKEKALNYYLKSLKISELLGLKKMMDISECNIGRIYAELGDFRNSEIHYDKALSLAREIKSIGMEATILIYRSTSYILWKKYEESLKHGIAGLTLIKKIDALATEKLAYESLSTASLKLGDFKNAYLYYRSFKALNDSIFNEANSKQIFEMQTKYETEKKEKENELLRKGIELQQLTINKEANFRKFLVVITVLILLLAILLYGKVQNRKRNEIVLEKKVKVRTKELEEAKEKAEENDKFKSAFLANISHEIRTPMNGIMGFAELLKRPKLDESKQNDFILKIEESGRRMLHIINNLVEISKLESGQKVLAINMVDINHEIELIFRKFELEAKKKGLGFGFLIPNNCRGLVIKTDEGKLNAILTYLLNNAMKFTQSGSVEFGYLRKSNNLEFFVKDTGIGIAEDMKDVVFERFIQADLAADKQYDGAGLGLSISKAYVELLGGEIWVESTFWKGSTFYFTVPLQEQKEVKYLFDAADKHSI